MTSPNTIIADMQDVETNLRQQIAHLNDEIAGLKSDLVRASKRGDELAESMRNIFPSAHRLALELECLLLDTKDMAIVTKWWESANESLDQWREFCREDAQC